MQFSDPWLKFLAAGGLYISVGLTILGTVAAFISGMAGLELSRRSDREVASLGIAASTANRHAGEANQRAEEAHERAVALEVDLERERAARLELEKGLAPRLVTASQQAKLKRGLAALKLEPIYVFKLGPPETTHFGDLLSMALESMGLFAGGTTRDYGAGYTGLTVHVPGAVVANEDLWADPLVVALKRANIAVTGVSKGPGGTPLDTKDPAFSPDRYFLIIGERPLQPDRNLPTLSPPKPGVPFYYLSFPDTPAKKPSSRRKPKGGG